MPDGSAERTTNPRGQGQNLREEILDAAAHLLAESPAEKVTLRGIARQAGIAAPSIYPHFADRGAIVDEVVARTFGRLDVAVRRAARRHETPVARLEAILLAYLRFAGRNPGLYRILFERGGENVAPDRHTYPEGLHAFTLFRETLRECVAAGTSTSTDPDTDSVALWAAAHGLVLLERATPGFPLPTQRLFVSRLMAGPAHIAR